jgi:hypothetical protein
MINNTVKPKTAPLQAAPAIGYQSGFNAGGHAVNASQVQSQFAKDSQHRPQQVSAGGARATQDLQKSQQYNAQAQFQRGLESANAQKNMQDQAMRSELMQTGLANQAQVYGDITKRATDQVGLAAQLQEAMIRSQFALKQALLT